MLLPELGLANGVSSLRLLGLVLLPELGLDPVIGWSVVRLALPVFCEKSAIKATTAMSITINASGLAIKLTKARCRRLILSGV